MCLIVKENAKIKIAHKPILTWKYVSAYPTNWSSMLYNTDEVHEYGVPCQGNKKIVAGYEIKKEAIEHLEIRSPMHTYHGMVSYGFHSYYSPLKLRREYCNAHVNYQMRPCVIPKGSETVDGVDGDVVSTQIIVFKNLWQAIKYIIKNR